MRYRITERNGDLIVEEDSYVGGGNCNYDLWGSADNWIQKSIYTVIIIAMQIALGIYVWKNAELVIWSDSIECFAVMNVWMFADALVCHSMCRSARFRLGAVICMLSRYVMLGDVIYYSVIKHWEWGLLLFAIIQVFIAGGPFEIMDFYVRDLFGRNPAEQWDKRSVYLLIAVAVIELPFLVLALFWVSFSINWGLALIAKIFVVHTAVELLFCAATKFQLGCLICTISNVVVGTYHYCQLTIMTHGELGTTAIVIGAVLCFGMLAFSAILDRVSYKGKNII